jgi:hypothetical protein
MPVAARTAHRLRLAAAGALVEHQAQHSSVTVAIGQGPMSSSIQARGLFVAYGGEVEVTTGVCSELWPRYCWISRKLTTASSKCLA